MLTALLNSLTRRKFRTERFDMELAAPSTHRPAPPLSGNTMLAPCPPPISAMMYTTNGWIPLYRANLLQGFGQRGFLRLKNRSGEVVQGIISCLQHEDGSGLSFNIVFETGEKLYLRCVG